MPPDVSVIIPAYNAIPLIRGAVESVLAQTGVMAEIVIAADDDLNYADFLLASGIEAHHYVMCRTPHPSSGPAVARNLAVETASSPILAPLDADDTFAPDRLRLLLAEVDRHGVVTGPTVERNLSGRQLRTAQPAVPNCTLNAEDLCTVRMPYFPLFHRQFYGAGWPNLAFAEDLVFNLSLLNQAGAYPFVKTAHYLYLQHNGSISNAVDSVDKARLGYQQILRALDADVWGWNADITRVLHTAITEDLAAVEAHLERDAGGESHEWRDVVRMPHEGQSEDAS